MLNSDTHNIKYIARRVSAAALAVCITGAGIIIPGVQPERVEAATAAPTATAKVNSSDGVIMRKSPSTTSAKVTGLADNTKLTIKKEVFKTRTKTGSKYKWFYVSAKGKTGYIRSDLVDSITYTKLKSVTTDGINYRAGAGPEMKKIGTINVNSTVYVVLKATNSVSGDTWYKIRKNFKYRYVSAKYVKLGTSTSGSSGSSGSGTGGSSGSSAGTSGPTSDAARALLKKATSGGDDRQVYTFNEDNCTKKFGVKGYNNIWTPQAMTYTGTKYYVLYGTGDGQRIVTYSKTGERLAATNFSSNIGHPNGITWNPNTGKCYIFKGNQYKIYTWNPETNKFGTATTPYSSSGVAYDKYTNKIYCSSQTGIRVYSADGKFTHEKLFSRCHYDSKIYIQDCGAHRGIVFHGISGSDKANTNYIDFYRASTGKYLGSVKVTIGEVESFTVNDKGYLEMLINKPGYTDYIWTTPLKVSELA